MVAPRDGVLEQQARRAGSPRVRRVAVGRARLELDRGPGDVPHHRLAKRHIDVDHLACRVLARPVRRRDRLDPREPAVRLKVPLAGVEQAVSAGVWQGQGRREAVQHGGYGASVEG